MSLRAKLLTVAVLAAIVVAVAGITVNTRSGERSAAPGPLALAQSFERALAKGDCPAVKKLVVAPGEIDCGFIAEAAESMKQIDVGAIGYRLTASGKESATVGLDVGGEKDSLDLVKVDGTWLVLFDTAA